MGQAAGGTNVVQPSAANWSDRFAALRPSAPSGGSSGGWGGAAAGIPSGYQPGEERPAAVSKFAEADAGVWKPTEGDRILSGDNFSNSSYAGGDGFAASSSSRGFGATANNGLGGYGGSIGSNYDAGNYDAKMSSFSTDVSDLRGDGGSNYAGSGGGVPRGYGNLDMLGHNGGGGCYGGMGAHAASFSSHATSHATEFGPGGRGASDDPFGSMPPEPPRPGGMLASRDSWDVGSIVEVFSAGAGRWFPARVMQVEPARDCPDEVLTVQFFMDDGPKQKAMYRGDASQMAPLGAHLAGMLPPGFQTRASHSRPGQSVYFDGTSGVKYASPELAWQVHFERLLKQPAAAGLETVASLVPPAAGLAPMPTSAAVPGSYGSNGAPRSMEASSGYERGFEDPDPSKVALPAFGCVSQSGNQAAYLGYIGAVGPGGGGVATGAPAKYAPAAASAGAPSVPRRPARPVANPQMQAWQEDPFSEWRR